MSRNLSELLGRKGMVENLFEKLGQSAAEKGTFSKEELDNLADEFLHFFFEFCVIDIFMDSHYSNVNFIAVHQIFV